jgi:glutathione S-transferase
VKYEEVNHVIEAEGLRLVLLRGFPSPWGQAAKAMMEFKGLEFTAGALEAGGENTAVVTWSGVNSAPIVAWNEEPPLNRWDDILMLLERLAPERPLIPKEPSERAQLFGLSYLICGQLGFGWNRRLDGVHKQVQSGQPAGWLGEKYGYNETDGELAAHRAVDFLNYLTDILKAQQQRGSRYILGDSVTAVDFYWAAFSNLAVIQPPEECPLDPAIRPMFENVTPSVAAAVDPILIEHRNFIMQSYFKIPMEL